MLRQVKLGLHSELESCGICSLLKSVNDTSQSHTCLVWVRCTLHLTRRNQVPPAVLSEGLLCPVNDLHKIVNSLAVDGAADTARDLPSSPMLSCCSVVVNVIHDLGGSVCNSILIDNNPALAARFVSYVQNQKLIEACGTLTFWYIHV